MTTLTLRRCREKAYHSGEAYPPPAPFSLSKDWREGGEQGVGSNLFRILTVENKSEWRKQLWQQWLQLQAQMKNENMFH